jgi:hypothetical protein
MARVRRLFGPGAVAPGDGAEGQPDAARAWLAELTPPAALARWAGPFDDLRSCWDACPDPEWLLWLAARTCGPGESRGPVVLCAADVAAFARRGARAVDPRVTRALETVRQWAGPGAQDLQLLAAECDALDAAHESARMVDREAGRARASFRSAPRRRPGSAGMNRALSAVHQWREAERAHWLALAALSAVRAAAQAGDAAVPPAAWAGHVSQSAAFALRAMSQQHSADARPGRLVTRRCVRLARCRLAEPGTVSPGSAAPPGAASPGSASPGGAARDR